MTNIFIVESSEIRGGLEALPTKGEAVAYALGFQEAKVWRYQVTPSKSGAKLFCSLYNHSGWAGVDREMVYETPKI